jgi:hypothetical protein
MAACRSPSIQPITSQPFFAAAAYSHLGCFIYHLLGINKSRLAFLSYPFPPTAQFATVPSSHLPAVCKRFWLVARITIALGALRQISEASTRETPLGTQLVSRFASPVLATNTEPPLPALQVRPASHTASKFTTHSLLSNILGSSSSR